MSRLVGKELTKLLLDRLNGQNVTPHESKIIPIFTLDDLGWPHPALLSYFEVVAGAPQVSRFRIATEQLLEDQEPNAEITSGLTYGRLTKREGTDFAAKVLRLLREKS